MLLREGKINKSDFYSFLFFVVLFFLNIGVKEIFRLMPTPNHILIGGAILSIISFSLLLKTHIFFSKIKLYIILLYIFLILSSFTANVPSYGIQKAYLGVLLPTTLFNIFLFRRWDEKVLQRAFLFSVLIISLFGILYKLKNGFFVREVSYGLMGPITFGWLNGMAFLMTALRTRKNFSILVLTLFFFLMVIWSGSKGPLIGLIIFVLFYFKKILGNNKKIRIIIFIISILLGSILYTHRSEIRAINMFGNLIENPQEYSEGVGRGSIGTRLDYIDLSLDSFRSYPLLGKGFGGWQEGYFIEHFYPHNIFFELLAEIGLIGTICFIAIFVFLRYDNIFGIIGLFGLTTLLFSGDLSYFRYAFFPLLISYYITKFK